MCASNSISIDFLIPFGDEEWPGLRVSFHRWLPIGKENGIARVLGRYRVVLWFEKENIYVLNHSLREDVSRWADLPVGKVHITVFVEEISEDLARFILERGKLDGASDPETGFTREQIAELNSDFCTLGKDVLSLAIECFNRFVDFTRVEKRQYWLTRRPFREGMINSDNIRFQAHVTIPSAAWVVPWRPKFVDVLTVEFPTSHDHSITESEWLAAQAYLSTDARPPTVKEFISNSLALLDAGHTRSAVVEIIAALELAVNGFARNPDTAKLESPNTRGIDLNRLSNTREHLGFSSFFFYVVPIIFAAERLSESSLNSAGRLINLRQTVVHSGQRNFPDFYTLRGYIRDVAEVCLILIDSTAAS
jgi:hypothetical protein